MSKRKIIIICISFFGIVLGLAGLTRAGYIPNFLGWEILCSEKEEPKPIKHKLPKQKRNNNTTNDTIPHHYMPKNPEPGVCYKPIIYFYPPSKQKVKVELDYQGELIADYPKYDPKIKGWEVTAFPDGKIIDQADNKEYSYLFWEGKPAIPMHYDFSTGFMVKGDMVREFLQNTLSKMGLTPKEYNEFIIYWYPLMKNNKYNLIHFAGQEYTRTAPLNITPKPDALLRVFMVFKAMNHPVEVEAQEFEPFVRKGFTVVEWGGSFVENQIN